MLATQQYTTVYIVFANLPYSSLLMDLVLMSWASEDIVHLLVVFLDFTD